MSLTSRDNVYTLHSIDSKDTNLLDEVVGEQVLQKLPLIDTSTADAVLANGVEGLAQNVSSVLASAPQDLIPSIEVRYHDLKVHVDVQVGTSGKEEIPTIASAAFRSLTQCFRKKTEQKVTILEGISGIFRPKTLTLVLGHPGSGKSALMKILSNKFPFTKHMTKSGTISYSGYTLEELGNRLSRYVSYVDQVDLHFPNLTVDETFKFAHSCMNGDRLTSYFVDSLTKPNDANAQARIDAMLRLNTIFPDIVLALLGLGHCKDTLVGNAMIRGISGGEKKRVTTGECFFGRKRVLLLDEISTGLDSAATHDIIKDLGYLAKNLGLTIIISLLQPPPEVYNLFDEVLFIDKGQVIFHGPRERVPSHFESLGYECPPRRDIADFLLDIVTPNNIQYQTIAPAAWITVPKTSAEFAERFKDTDLYENIVRDLGNGYSSKEHYRKYMESLPQFRQSFFDGLVTLMHRQKLLVFRDKAYIIGRSCMVLLCSVLYGSTFWNIPPSNFQVVIGLLFSSLMFIGLGAAPQIANFSFGREIFYKQRSNNFFRTSSYTLSLVITQIPLSLIEGLLLGVVVYWMAALVPVWYRFLIFVLVLFLTNLSFHAFFLLTTSVAPTEVVAHPISMIFILFFVIFAGFVMTYDLIPKYWIWLYWISPMSWALRSLLVNQYSEERFQVCEFAGFDYCKVYGKKFGEYSLGLYNVASESSWVWYGILYLITFCLVCVILATLALENIHHHPPKAVKLKQDDDEMVKSGQTPNSHQVEITITSTSVTPITLSFSNLFYSVHAPGDRHEEIHLLNDVSGYACPGKMTALMGSSGAGKTTLMDVIASRKTGGKVKGQILLNGYPATKTAMKRCTGYCEQLDLHSKASTVKEAFVFSALLRQSAEVPTDAKLKSAQDCLDLLQLNDIADTLIQGLSIEQLKRTSIGVEIAAMPSILFLDEPTSGLDAQSAKTIMTGVRNIARSGRTVICTIHQPSTHVFSLFDSLLLLKRGGETVYFGDLGGRECQTLINYFESIPGTIPIERGYNPATWILEVIGAGVGHQVTLDYAEEFRKSPLKEKCDQELLRISQKIDSPGQQVLFKSKRAAPTYVQTQILLTRFFRLYWRLPAYNLTRYIIQIFLALVFGSIYTGTDYSTFEGVNSGVGMIFLSTVFLSATAMIASLPVMNAERSVYYRERASETYGPYSYFVAVGVTEIPYVFTSVFVFTSIFFPLVGFEGTSTFFYYYIILSLYVLLYVALGQALSFALPTTAIASLCGALLNTIFVLFAGFNPPQTSIPIGYEWIYHISPTTYSISALASTVFASCPGAGCATIPNGPPGVNGTTVKHYVETNFHMRYNDRTQHILILLGMLIALRLIGLLALRFISHQKK